LELMYDLMNHGVRHKLTTEGARKV
jgi:hypothetical protein